MENKDIKDRFEQLANKWLNKTITPAEEIEFAVWYNDAQDKNLEIPEEIALNEEAHKQKMYAAIKGTLNQKTRRKFRIWSSLTAAAALLIVIGTSLYFFSNQNQIKNSTQAKNSRKIEPGGNKAFLTLSNGTKIVLNNLKNGEVTEQSGVKISKASDGQLIYNITAVQPGNNQLHTEYNTIETPNGGQYQVILPDGTRVWLNAATRLKYPVYFNATNRKVELSGEAYFEVAKNKAKPFIVSTENQTVEVLGTHFNLNAYSNEESTKTTLLEGAVKVAPINEVKTHTATLSPGEQAVFTGRNLSVKNVDVEQAVAWKNGFFQFYHSDLKSVMRQVSRWYNIDVVYDGKTPAKEFSGKIQRNVTADELVDALNFSGIRCEIKNAKIVVKL